MRGRGVKPLGGIHARHQDRDLVYERKNARGVGISQDRFAGMIMFAAPLRVQNCRALTVVFALRADSSSSSRRSP
jgi:hypothetical protein